MATPTCRPWSISATRRDLHQTQQEREAEMPTIDFIKKTFKRRCKAKKGNSLEQPWSSAWWERLQDSPGEVQRTDQCKLGAQNEDGEPILKPTGLHADFHLRHCISRCNGHRGLRHAWLQGAVGGKNRTTMASVYPQNLCRAIIKDAKKFANHVNLYDYKCERCALGRAATADMEHSFLPGECCYGKWLEGQNPRERSRLQGEQQAQNDIFDALRKEALSNLKVIAGQKIFARQLRF